MRLDFLSNTAVFRSESTTGALIFGMDTGDLLLLLRPKKAENPLYPLGVGSNDGGTEGSSSEKEFRSLLLLLLDFIIFTFSGDPATVFMISDLSLQSLCPNVGCEGI